MTFHNKPEWHILDLNEALREHGLPVDKPSQLADTFRSGWVAAQRNFEENLQND